MKKNIVKKIVSLALITALSVTVFAACGSGKTEMKSGGSIVTAGSTSVQPLSEELAAAFMDSNSDYTVDVQGGGSGQGIKSIVEGIADIGALSRNLKEEEKTQINKEILIAMDGIAVIVNNETKVENLTLEEIRQIYTGEISNWSQVGGVDAKITVVSREEGSGTRGAFTEITGISAKDENGNEIDNTVGSALIQPSTGSVKSTVSKTPNTIGYVSIGGLDDSIKTISIEGQKPTVELVKSGDYKISRPFIYVVGPELSDAAKMYIDFVLSEEGQLIVEESGFISTI